VSMPKYGAGHCLLHNILTNTASKVGLAVCESRYFGTFLCKKTKTVQSIFQTSFDRQKLGNLAQCVKNKIVLFSLGL
jgi:hypothetical protein